MGLEKKGEKKSRCKKVLIKVSFDLKCVESEREWRFNIKGVKSVQLSMT